MKDWANELILMGKRGVLGSKMHDVASLRKRSLMVGSASREDDEGEIKSGDK